MATSRHASYFPGRRRQKLVYFVPAGLSTAGTADRDRGVTSATGTADRLQSRRDRPPAASARGAVVTVTKGTWNARQLLAGPQRRGPPAGRPLRRRRATGARRPTALGPADLAPRLV